ncbi:MAG: methyltransferase [Patescibacteria group bacterium]
MEHFSTTRLDFLKNALLDRSVGAVSVSSQSVVNDVLGRLPKILQKVVEYGPGDGVITLAILDRLSPHGILFVVEPNEEFVQLLKNINDKRLIVLHRKAQDLTPKQLEDMGNADAVVASMPFSFLTEEERHKIILDAYELLTYDGKFIVFHQYSWLMRNKLKQKFRSVSLSFEPRNFPPCFVIEARK